MKTYLLGCLAAVSAAFTAHASYGTFTWCGGGSNNNWNNKDNWVGGVAPGGWDYTVFPAGTDWVVNVPKSISHIGIKMEDGEGSLTLTGPGPLLDASYSGTWLNVGSGRTLVVDGLRLTAWNLDQRGEIRIANGGAVEILHPKSGTTTRLIHGDAKLMLENGSFLTDEGEYLYVSNRAEVIVQVGDFINKRGVSFHDNSRFLMVGGSYQAFYPYYSVYTFAGQSTADVFSGTVRWMESSGVSAYMAAREFKKMAPKKGGSIICPRGPTSVPGDKGDGYKNGAIDLSTSTGVFAFGGEVFVTNRISATNGAFRTQSYAGLTGRCALCELSQPQSGFQ